MRKQRGGLSDLPKWVLSQESNPGIAASEPSLLTRLVVFIREMTAKMLISKGGGWDSMGQCMRKCFVNCKKLCKWKVGPYLLILVLVANRRTVPSSEWHFLTLCAFAVWLTVLSLRQWPQDSVLLLCRPQARRSYPAEGDCWLLAHGALLTCHIAILSRCPAAQLPVMLD